jgi:hypothetical protein
VILGAFADLHEIETGFGVYGGIPSALYVKIILLVLVDINF